MPKILERLTGGKKKAPQLGGTNPKNIDAMVAAGELTPEEGRKIKARIKQKRKESKE